MTCSYIHAAPRPLSRAKTLTLPPFTASVPFKILLLAALAATVLVCDTAHADDAPYCREYQQRVTIGGEVRETYGTACQQPDGSWKMMDKPPVAEDVAPANTTVQTVQTTYVTEPVRYVYADPVVYPAWGLSVGFDDWGHRGWRGGDGWHGGGWRH